MSEIIMKPFCFLSYLNLKLLKKKNALIDKYDQNFIIYKKDLENISLLKYSLHLKHDTLSELLGEIY